MSDQLVQHTHILFLIPSLHGGGAERVITTLLQNLDRSSFKLTLALVDTKEAVFLKAVPTDVEFIDLNCQRVRYALPKIIALIWKLRPDVVFSTLGHLNLALALLKPFLPRHPRYIARETNILSQVLAAGRIPWLWQWMYRLFYNNHDAVVCQSQDMLDDLVANWALSKERAVLIYNPVDVELIRRLVAGSSPDNYLEFEKDSVRVQLVAAGRLVDQKGFDLLIEAMKLLQYTQIRLTILGAGPLRTNLERLAQALGVADLVRFTGFQTNPYAWFAQADAFVLSSRYEGFPNVVLESLACGTPVIAVPAPGGTRELLDNIPQCVVAEEISAHALAEAIEEWLKSSRERVPEYAILPYRLSAIVPRYSRLFTGEAGRAAGKDRI